MKREEADRRKKLIKELIESDIYVPMKIKELSMFMQVPKSEKNILRELVYEMAAEGEIEISKSGKILRAEGALIGTYEAHNGGFGFVIIEGRKDDFYIAEEDSMNAMDGDTVEIRKLEKTHHHKSREAEIVKIIKRAHESIVGTFTIKHKDKGFGFVIPDNEHFTRDVFVAVERSKGAENGDKVVVKFTGYGDERHNPEGIITEIIGAYDAPGVDIESIVRAYDITEKFPDNVEKQAVRVAKPVSDADREGRRDLRELMMVTIDGEDARDLDDAVSLQMDGENYVLGVHIADVTNYVQESSALDKEAVKRATSVYLPDRVIPMLPKELSNGICSLNQREDRLALSCIMTINKKGKIVSSDICESVINTNRRMSYNEVQSFFDDTASDELKAECEDLIPMFMQMRELSHILREKRRKRGGIDFDFAESKVILDENMKAVDIIECKRTEAAMLIEDFMLAANETVAETCFYEELPFVYRTHETPDMEKIESLRRFVINLGFHFKASRDEVHPKEVQKLLNEVKDTPEEALISRLALRSMKQAKYTTEPIGHFGLATNYYCHFTSPIRRYPDLQIHRIIKDQLRGRMSDRKYSHYEKILPEIAKHSSEMERHADEAERESVKLKKAEFMLDHVGEVFGGVISGLTNYGIFVELDNTVEGMIRLQDIEGDYYIYDENSMSVNATHSKKSFKLGQRLNVKVVYVDKELKEIDLLLAEEEEENAE
ncbi:MAG: ribonuclease R [Lachnospiraceae bacterium]|nr:ribonuclease R [Lachnospiraceae bacterium]MDN4742558.1 ribonuclease R [Lachnospiraceae bacterium C1.1]